MNNNIQFVEIRRLCSILSKYQSQDHVILIGSWATYFYQTIWPTYQPIIRTTDVDFYTGFNHSSRQIDLPKILQENQYVVDVKTGSYQQFIFNTRGFEIEFVTHLRRNQKVVFLVKNLNIQAVTLPHHEKITLDQTILYQFDENTTIRIIRPSLYVIIKLLINKKRSKEKGMKDIESIKSIIPFLIDDYHEIGNFRQLIDHLSNHQKRFCIKVIKDEHLDELMKLFV